MKLQDCILDITHVSMAPLKKTGPEEDWNDALQSGVIPKSLFILYVHADYLSFGSAPRFLADSENILFSYFAMLVRSLKNLLIEATELTTEFVQAEAQKYDPGKKSRGESWDPKADIQASRAFKYLLVTSSGILDVLADLVALFFTGHISHLRLGRAQFSRLEDWLKQPFASGSTIVTPSEYHLSELYHRLRELIHVDSPEKDWLPLMRLYRNKAAHMGEQMFQYVGLHDENAKFYTFVPRQWPYIKEKHLKPVDSNHPTDPLEIRTSCEQTLVHEDVVSYTQGLCLKILTVVYTTLTVIDSAYRDFSQFPVNEAALAELEESSKSFDFKYFQD